MVGGAPGAVGFTMFTPCTLPGEFTLSTSKCMPPPKESYHHGDLANALVRAATARIELGGSEGCSLREVARDVGVSPNAAYRHFEDKSALLTAVAAEGFDLLSLRMQEAMASVGSVSVRAGDAAIERLKAVGRAYVALAAEKPELFRLMYGPNGRSCLDLKSGQLKEPSPGELLGRVLDALVEAGILKPERRAMAEVSVWAAVHGFASLSIDRPASVHQPGARDASLESFLDFTVAGICDGLAVPPRRSRPTAKIR